MTQALKAPASWVDGTPVSVWVIGAGGNGGEVVDALSQFHLALQALGGAGLDVAIFDDARVREVNLVRQRFWQADVGQHKAVVLAHRYNTLLGTTWQGIPMRLETALSHFQPQHAPQIIISAVDLPSARRFIGNGLSGEGDEEGGAFSPYQLSNTLWLDLGNRARNGQAILGELLPNEQYPNVVAHYPELADLEDDTSKSCSTAEAIAAQDCLINRAVATSGMALVWELLRHGQTEKNGIVVDLKSGMQIPLAFPDAGMQTPAAQDGCATRVSA